MLIDETGMLMRPLVRRSLARRGKPPVVRYQSNHRQKVSVQGAIVMGFDGEGGVVAEALRTRTYADAYVDGQKTAQLLRRLLAEFGEDGRPLIVVWDRGNMHKGPHVRQVLEAFADRLSIEQLPPYCPDLNPVEWLWSWMKYGELVNFCPRDVRHLSSRVATAIVKAAERQPLLQGFIRAAGLATHEAAGR